MAGLMRTGRGKKEEKQQSGHHSSLMTIFAVTFQLLTMEERISDQSKTIKTNSIILHISQGLIRPSDIQAAERSKDDDNLKLTVQDVSLLQLLSCGPLAESPEGKKKRKKKETGEKLFLNTFSSQ